LKNSCEVKRDEHRTDYDKERPGPRTMANRKKRKTKKMKQSAKTQAYRRAGGLWKERRLGFRKGWGGEKRHYVGRWNALRK